MKIMKVRVEFDIEPEELAELQQQYFKYCMENGMDVSQFFANNMMSYISNSSENTNAVEMWTKMAQNYQNFMMQHNPLFQTFFSSDSNEKK